MSLIPLFVIEKKYLGSEREIRAMSCKAKIKKQIDEKTNLQR